MGQDLIEINVTEIPELVTANITETPEIVTVNIYEIAGPPGENGTSAPERVIGETPSGAIDGSNAIFFTAFNFIPGSEEVFIGIQLKKLEDYNTVGNNQITLYASPLAGENLTINYNKL